MKPRTFLFITSSAIIATAGTARAAPPDLSVGKPFPNLTLPALNGGRPMSIADFRGQKVILHVFASW